jgi:hypothetical protein
MLTEEHFPDPVLTANFYCAGRLDEILREIVAPLRNETGAAGYFWTMRYNRGGEHLKLRLHGPAAWGLVARDLLAERAERFFASLGDLNGEPAHVAATSQAPPIDLEDEAPDGHPDRSLVWTRYRRSHISFAGKPLLLDDTYVALASRCLGRACELVLDSLGEGLSPKRRQTPLLQALIGGIAALGFPAELRGAYFAFHRDWLIRFLLVRRDAGPDKTVELTARFDLQTQALGASLGALREVAEEAWSSTSDAGDPDAWQRSLVDLFRYVSRLPALENPIDPFAADPSFPPLFKVFHGFANQLGLNPLDEAFVHHLLLGMTLPPGTAGPPVRWTADGGAT